MNRKRVCKKLNLMLRRNTRRICIAVLATGLFFTIYSLLSIFSPSLNYSLGVLECSDRESVKVITHLCSLYKGKRVMGNICHDICQGDFVFHKCLNYRNGKYALLVDCINTCIKGKTISAVLKMSHVNSSELDNFLHNIDQQIRQQFSFVKVYDNNVHLVDYLVNQDIVETALMDRLNSEYGFTQPRENSLSNLLWKKLDDKDLHDDSKEDAVSISLVRTLWSLMSQGEYRVSTVFKEWNLFPQIFGYCGPLYLSEYAPFDSRLDRRLFSRSHFSWRERVSKAMQVLSLIQLADSLNYPIHFCDVKSPHFGTAIDGTVRFIDADTVFTNKTLNRDLGAPKCKNHHDCAFFDCESWCFHDHGTCSPLRTNNNLQVTCAKILRNDNSSIFEGLLSNPPSSIADNLKTLLNSCAEDVVDYVEGIPMRTPGQNVLFKLQNLLMESLNADDI